MKHIGTWVKIGTFSLALGLGSAALAQTEGSGGAEPPSGAGDTMGDTTRQPPGTEEPQRPDRRQKEQQPGTMQEGSGMPGETQPPSPPPSGEHDTGSQGGGSER